MKMNIQNVLGYRNDMVLPIVLTTAIKPANNGCYQYTKICIDAVSIVNIEDRPLFTQVELSTANHMETIDVIEHKEQVLTIIGLAFYESDKFELFRQWMMKGGQQ